MLRQRRFPRLLAALLVCGVLVLSACSSSSGNSTDFTFSTSNKLGTIISASDRKTAQDVGGTLISGGQLSLSQSKGKVTLLNFWASWCGPCKIETPQLDSLYRQMKTQGVQFVGFDTHEYNSSAGKTFVAENDITFPIVEDQAGRNVLKLGNIPSSLPFTVLVDKQGRVAAVYVGGVTPKDLQKPLTTLLAER